jgi:hypothetical protein
VSLAVLSLASPTFSPFWCSDAKGGEKVEFYLGPSCVGYLSYLLFGCSSLDFIASYWLELSFVV